MSEKLFRFHWRDGSVNEGPGVDEGDAARRLGFGAGALAALDYWEAVADPAGPEYRFVPDDRGPGHSRWRIEASPNEYALRLRRAALWLKQSSVLFKPGVTLAPETIEKTREAAALLYDAAMQTFTGPGLADSSGYAPPSPEQEET